MQTYLNALWQNLIDQPWATVAGLLATGLVITSYLAKTPAGLRFQMGTGTLFQALHFFLLNAPTASLIALSVTARSWLSIFTKTRKSKLGLFLFFSVWFLSMAIVSWQDWRSLVPAMAAINSTAAFAFFNGIRMRIMLIISSLIWMASGFLWGSVPTMLQECLALTMNLTGLIRDFRRTPAPQPLKDTHNVQK